MVLLNINKQNCLLGEWIMLGKCYWYRKETNFCKNWILFLIYRTGNHNRPQILNELRGSKKYNYCNYDENFYNPFHL